jgi:hypothetical protein
MSVFCFQAILLEPNIEYHSNPLAARKYSEDPVGFHHEVQLSLRGGMFWGLRFANCITDTGEVEEIARTRSKSIEGSNPIRSKRRRMEEDSITSMCAAFNREASMQIKPEISPPEDDDRKKRKL